MTTTTESAGGKDEKREKQGGEEGTGKLTVTKSVGGVVTKEEI